MGKFSVSHTIDCDAERFWKVFLDKAFNEHLYREALGFPAFTILDQREDGDRVIRKVTGTPKVNMPAPVAKLLGPSFDYTEEATLDRKTGVWRWTMKTSVMTDKLRQEGSMRLEPIGDKQVRRVADLLIEAKVFGIGGLIESSAEKELRNGWDKSADVMNRWLREKP